jgi:hypothetical protein
VGGAITLWPAENPFDFLATPTQQRQFEPLISITLLPGYYRHSSSFWPSYDHKVVGHSSRPSFCCVLAVETNELNC